MGEDRSVPQRTGIKWSSSGCWGQLGAKHAGPKREWRPSNACSGVEVGRSNPRLKPTAIFVRNPFKAVPEVSPISLLIAKRD